MMQAFSAPTARAIITHAKNNLTDLLIDITKISDYERHKDARSVNEKILAATRTLHDIDKQLFQQTMIRLEEIETSENKRAIMYINGKGILQLTEYFFMSTHLESGLKFLPHINTENERDNAIYFVEATDGFRLGEKTMNLASVLERTHISCPSKVLWSPVNETIEQHEGQRAFRLEFSQPIYA